MDLFAEYNHLIKASSRWVNNALEIYGFNINLHMQFLVNCTSETKFELYPFSTICNVCVCVCVILNIK